MIEVVNKYIDLVSQLGDYIKKSGVKAKVFADALGMSETYFHEKKRKGNWKPEEVRKIVGIVEAVRGAAG